MSTDMSIDCRPSIDRASVDISADTIGRHSVDTTYSTHDPHVCTTIMVKSLNGGGWGGGCIVAYEITLNNQYIAFQQLRGFK